VATPGEWLSRQLPAQLWAFGLGMFIARYHHKFPVNQLAYPLVGTGLLIVGVLHAQDALDAVLVAVGAALLILWAVHAKPSIPWARWPADISYGVYLWHITVTAMLGYLVSGPVLLVATVAGTCAVASASWFLLERPILRRASRKHEPKVDLRGDVQPTRSAGLRPA
jgi:peptidoglycan/LPS O-acetylase OafA/YrhL